MLIFRDAQNLSCAWTVQVGSYEGGGESLLVRDWESKFDVEWGRRTVNKKCRGSITICCQLCGYKLCLAFSFGACCLDLGNLVKDGSFKICCYFLNDLILGGVVSIDKYTPIPSTITPTAPA